MSTVSSMTRIVIATAFLSVGILSSVYILLNASSVSAQTATVRTTQTTQVTEVNPNKCPDFTQLLYFGSKDAQKDGEVMRLQKFFNKYYPEMYRAGFVNGVYGEELELAVRALQKKFSLVTPGLACRTGYGVVESKTRAFINGKQDCTPVIARKTITCETVPQCPSILTNLQSGSADREGFVGDVSRLQCFLVKNGFLGSTSTTGSFGISTERALIRYQASRGITQTGTAGPMTREAIAQCAPVKSATTGATTESSKFSLQLRPSSGTAPLTVNATFAVNGTTCTSYSIDWGDGTAPEEYDAGRPAVCSPRAIAEVFTHVYATRGSYTVSVKEGKDSLSRLQLSNQAQVIVE